MFLVLDHLSKIFVSEARGGDVVAVDDVCIEIEQGKFVTLLGPSGCGKTTTLRLIAGFEFPTEGQIILDGDEINELPPNQRDMAMVFQSYAIFPHLTVFENIAYGLRIKKLGTQEIRRQAGEVMELTELTGLENRAPNQLSGGQQQRVALARALVMHPKVLLFDEPLSNLDAKLRVQMRSEIRRIQQELGITSVYVTHDQDEAMVISDQIVVMHQGRIQQVGSAVQIYRHPVNRIVADFIGRANFLPVTITGEQAGQWEIELFGRPYSVTSAAEASLQPGDAATLLLRPESVRVGKESVPGQPSLPGIVRRTAYLGVQAEHDIEVNGTIVTVVRYDPQEKDLYPEGTTVNLDLVGENLYLLPNQTS